jgi:hypothetical protein
VSNNDAFSDWLSSDSWQDYRQQRAIRELDSEVAALNSSLYRQQSVSSQLRSQLAALQGTLDEKVNRLTRCFDAFVELSDIRATLALFDAPALVRHRSRQLLTSLAAGTDAPVVPPPRDDVPDYWLAPAIRALAVMLRGGESATDLAQAQSRDAERTALLITTTATLAGRHDLASAWLPKALPDMTAGLPVTLLHRQLWQEAARGTFGPAGYALVESRLRACVDRMDPDQRQAVARAWIAKVDGLAGPMNTRVTLIDKDPAISGAALAGRRLSALRARCEAPADEAPGAAAEAGTDGDGATGKAMLGELVRRLVDEGTDEEKPLLRRGVELRAVIENRPTEVEEAWDAPVASPEELLLADAFDTSAGPLGALARRIGAPWLEEASAGLLKATQVDPPTEMTVDTGSGSVRVTTAGVDAQAVTAMHNAVERAYPPLRVPDALTWALGAVAVVLIVLGVFLPTGLLVLAVVVAVGLLVGAVVRWRSGLQARYDQEHRKDSTLRDGDRKVEQGRVDLGKATTMLAETAEKASTDAAAVTAALARD